MINIGKRYSNIEPDQLKSVGVPLATVTIRPRANQCSSGSWP